MTPKILMSKAERAHKSANILLNIGDTEGACNRAYYAMFDAACAALIVSGAALPSGIGKTHSGLINAFSLHLIKTGKLPKEMGKLLNRAQEIRYIADYKADSIELIDAQEIVEQTKFFISVI